MKNFPMPPTLFFLSIIIMVSASFADLTNWNIPAAMYWIGWLVLVAGMMLSFAGSNLFKKKETNINTFQDPEKLVISGPFKYTRNPMYVGLILALLGTSLVTGTMIGFALLSLFIMIVANIYIPFEEGRMYAIFGQEYEDYVSKVRRWI